MDSAVRNADAQRAEPERPISTTVCRPWSSVQSSSLYQVSGWGQPYFSVSPHGHVTVKPNPELSQEVDLFALTEDLKARGLSLPVLVRFPGILEHRIRSINESFSRAILSSGYNGTYQGVYPVKVNQQRHIVTEVVRLGAPWQFGLEVGSKPELLIALSAAQGPGLIICNGYKDPGYIETALLAQRLDKTVIIVVEQLKELEYALTAADKFGIRPVFGVRAKLSSKGMGRWANSAGDSAKFGLSAPEIVDLVDRLSERNMLDTLQLLHFHIGSQVSSIIPIKNALKEAANLYVELAKMGCQLNRIDVGGGLAIDYDGSQTDFHASRNYTLDEYAADVVSAVKEACDREGFPHPTLVSESGRAVVAHQSVLVFDVVGAHQIAIDKPSAPPADAHSVLQLLYETYLGILPDNVQESWHDACQAKEEVQNLFKFGYLGLRERAYGERLFWACCRKTEETLRRVSFVPEELQTLANRLSAIYYCNFSIFQSAPDSWAIDQLFPIMPIHRLHERPSVQARLADLTCDSDGVIDRFIDAEDVRETLPVHPMRQGEPYYLAMFLNGAYQEILGDLHNLFGDTNAVHVACTDYGYRIDHVIKGDSMADVLSYVAYAPEQMTEAIRSQAEAALDGGRMTVAQMRVLMNHYENSMGSYTYLSDGTQPF